MRFMTLYKPGTENAAPTEQEIANVGRLIEEMAKAGVLLATDGLQPSSKGARVEITEGGKFTVTDGPFAETKEVIGGYAIIQVNSKEEAIELTKRFLKAMGKGVSEVRQMQDAPAFERGERGQAELAARR